MNHSRVQGNFFNSFFTRFSKASASFVLTLFIANACLSGTSLAAIQPYNHDVPRLTQEGLGWALPQDLGRVKAWLRPSAGQSLLVHIQDAHANPSAQENIRKILHWLRDQSTQQGKSLRVFVEGASGELHPEYLDLVPEYEAAGDETVKHLAAQGELSGADLFGWDLHRHSSAFGNDKVLITGAEDSALYRENLRTYRELLNERGELDALLRPLHESLERESSRVFPPKLREFIKERRLRKEGDYGSGYAAPQWQAYLPFLTKLAKEVLSVDFDNRFEQLRFPQIVRLRALGKMAGSYDAAKAAREKDILIQQLQKFSADDAARRIFLELSQLESSAEPRHVLEAAWTFAAANHVSLAASPQFCQWAGETVLSAEINSVGLLREIRLIETALFEKMAVTAAEKSLLTVYDDLSSFEKLVKLELTRDDFEAMSGQPAAALLEQQPFFKENWNKKLSAAESKARFFYSGAVKRDHVLAERALAETTAENVTVLITGGFHTEGLENILQQKGMGYVVIEPKITQMDKGESYRRVLKEENADLSAYLLGTAFNKQEAIFLKSYLEIAVPALWEKHGVSHAQIASKIAAALNQHEILKGRLHASAEAITGASRLTLASLSAVPNGPSNAATALSFVAANNLIQTPVEFSSNDARFDVLAGSASTIVLEIKPLGVETRAQQAAGDREAEGLYSFEVQGETPGSRSEVRLWAARELTPDASGIELWPADGTGDIGGISFTADELRELPSVRVKGRLPQDQYGYDFRQMWWSVDGPQNAAVASDLIADVFRQVNARFFKKGERREDLDRVVNALTGSLPMDGSDTHLNRLIRLFFSVKEGDELRFFDEQQVFPRPWFYLGKNQLLGTLGHVDTRVKMLMEDYVKPPYGIEPYMSAEDARYLSEQVHLIMTYLLKHNNFQFLKYVNNLFVVALEDRIIELLVGSSLWKAPNSRYDDFQTEALARDLSSKDDYMLQLMRQRFPQLKDLRALQRSQGTEFSSVWSAQMMAAAITAGTLMFQRTFTADFSLNRANMFDKVTSTGVAADMSQIMPINHFNDLKLDIENAQRAGQTPHVVFLVDDVAECIPQLKMVEYLMVLYPRLKVTLWMNDYPVENNIWTGEFRRFVMDEDTYFPALKDMIQRGGRLDILKRHSNLLVPEPRWFNQGQTAAQLSQATALVMIGAAPFETIHLPNANTYYGLTIYHDFSSQLTGLPKETALFLHVPRGQKPYDFPHQRGAQLRPTAELFSGIILAPRSELRAAPPIKMTRELAELFAEYVHSFSALGRPGAGKDEVTTRFFRELNENLPPEKQFANLITGDWFRGVRRILGNKMETNDMQLFGAVIPLLPEAVRNAIVESQQVSDKGGIVRDETTLQFFRTVLELPAFKGKSIFANGLPRTIGQLIALDDGHFLPGGIDLFMILDVSEAEAKRRIDARLHEAQAHEPDGGPTHRTDDEPEHVSQRMSAFDHDTASMIEAVSTRRNAIVVSGEQDKESVYQEFLQKLNSYLQTLHAAPRSEVRHILSSRPLRTSRGLTESLQQIADREGVAILLPADVRGVTREMTNGINAETDELQIQLGMSWDDVLLSAFQTIAEEEGILNADLLPVMQLARTLLGEYASLLDSQGESFRIADILSSKRLLKRKTTLYAVAVQMLARPGDQFIFYVRGESQDQFSVKAAMASLTEVVQKLVRTAGRSGRRIQLPENYVQKRVLFIDAFGWSKIEMRRDIERRAAVKSSGLELAILDADPNFLESLIGLHAQLLDRGEEIHDLARLETPKILADDLDQHMVHKMDQWLRNKGLDNRLSERYAAMIQAVIQFAEAA